VGQRVPEPDRAGLGHEQAQSDRGGQRCGAVRSRQPADDRPVDVLAEQRGGPDRPPLRRRQPVGSGPDAVGEAAGQPGVPVGQQVLDDQRQPVGGADDVLMAARLVTRALGDHLLDVRGWQPA
jgi:hypothetical protein